MKLWGRCKMVVIACLLLAGCEQNNKAQNSLERYLGRLSNVLHVERQALSSEPRLLLPEKISGLKRREGEKDNSIGLLDLLALNQCVLQQSIAKNNNSLGKVAKASQRLIYELAFLKEAPACIALLTKNNNTALARQLEQERINKKQRLANNIWQATLGGEEFRDFWQFDGRLDNYPKQTSSAVVQAISDLNKQVSQWLAGSYDAESVQLESQLAVIKTGDGAELFAALTLQAAYLIQANQLVVASEAQRPVCGRHKVSKRGRILHNVVTKYFVTNVQPWSAAISHRYYQLIPELNTLEQLLKSSEPHDWATWRERRNQNLDNMLAVPKQHVKLISPILKRCQLAPA